MSQRSRIFRVFFSSTFNDFATERTALHAVVFPRLEEYCRQRRASFQAVDLRWGISEDAGRDQQTLEICLDEVKRCQRTSARPNFVLLLGSRYGWRPLPPRIPADEFQALRRVLPEEDNLHLDHWFKRDDNALSADYLLQPTGDANEWSQAEAVLRQALARAVRMQSWHEDDPRRVKYEASVTHQEILQGLFPTEAGPLPTEQHVLAYLRRMEPPRCLAPNDPRGTFADYVSDGSGGLTLDDQAQARLLRLTNRVRAFLPDGQRYEYAARWEGEVKLDLPALCDRVEGDLKRLIDEELARLDALAQEPGSEEARIHQAFGMERCHSFVGRMKLRQDVSNYLNGGSRQALVLLGPSGVGKTALMARAVAEVPPGWLVLERYLGATSASSDVRGLLDGLGRQLAHLVGDLFVPSEHLSELRRAFVAVLQKAGAQRRVVLFLDSLDQLSPTDNAHTLDWLPWELPPGVKLVLSALEAEGPVGLAARTARERVPSDHCLLVDPLEPAEADRLFFDEWLDKEANRRLQPGQRDAVQGKLQGCRLPLYLRVVFEEVRRWKSSDGIPLDLAPDTPGVLEQLFSRLEERRRHGPVLVRHALASLAAARQGLSDLELLDVMSRDGEVLRDFHATSPTERSKPVEDRLQRLPPIYWSRLYFDLAHYLSERLADGTTVLAFYHRQVAEAADRLYLDGDARRRTHQLLAAYFASQPHMLRDLARRPVPNLRKVSELGWQMEQAEDLEGLDRLLREETAEGRNSWFQACENAERTTAFLDDVRRAWRLADAVLSRGNGGPVGLQCRCALLAASVNSLANNLLPELLEALVRQGLWPVEQALAYARRTPDPGQKAKAMISLLSFLPSREQDVVVSEALAAAHGSDEAGDCVERLAAFAPQLPAGLLTQALTFARAIKSTWDRKDALAALVLQLPEPERYAVLAEALTDADYGEVRNVERTADMWIKLPEPERSALLDLAVSAVCAIGGPLYRTGAQVLSDLVPRLPEQERSGVLEAAFRVAQLYNRVALGALAAQFPSGLPAWAFDAACKIQDIVDRSRTLAALAAHLPEPERQAVLAEALRAARAAEYDWQRCYVRAELAPYLREPERSTVLAEALTAAHTIKDERERSHALATVAAQLPEPERSAVLTEALTAARQSGKYRSDALGSLAGQLSEPRHSAMLTEVLTAARAIGDERECARTLAALAPLVPEQARTDVLAQALSAARAIGDERERARTLAALAPQLPSGLLAHALTAIRAIRDERARSRALAAAAVQSPEPERSAGLAEALTAARAIRDEELVPALLELLPRFREPERPAVLAEALAAARDIRDEEARFRALAEVAAQVPEPERPALLADVQTAAADALPAARAIRDEKARLRVLAELAAQLPEEKRSAVLAEALAIARAFESTEDRARALAALAPGLASLPGQGLTAPWLDSLPVLAARIRRDLLTDLANLAPALVTMSGSNASTELLEVARAIADVARWWP